MDCILSFGMWVPVNLKYSKERLTVRPITIINSPSTHPLLPSSLLQITADTVNQPPSIIADVFPIRT